ncbi:hypothetical protein DYU05_06160 [Mucilaginibacter terrenus]|uniref:phospholipase D n=1 Tax=Mucilaginibacter terrenus TaxID=2482727 RepID=A0A3E2NW10_9SPHI|nr:phospholipase D-like domain-containing protein [Mucilaginibacter terrenus]RFZ85182.1 hypothetical protein DYU05_06160 [Mucilaginibacter terrenus]
MMELIEQQVINDNKEIYAKIQSELLNAEFEILIATGWFTDEDLFDIVLRKINEGIHVDIIIADNLENEKLDFELLRSKGASVLKIKNSGYGIMNQKFCVIDRRIALHGSYNWTKNARKNNQESIISTNHEETVTGLMAIFIGIKAKINEQKSDSNLPGAKTVAQADRVKSASVEGPDRTGAEFEQVLDSMIAAEVGSFDRKLLREQGFERCRANHGDHQVLYKSLDTLYSVFINDIDVIEDKKKRLEARIDEQRVKTKDKLNKISELQINHLEREHELNKANLNRKATDLDAEVQVLQKEIEEIRQTQIPHIKQQEAGIELQLRAAEQEQARPAIKWFEMLPSAVLAFVLFIYLLIFYSSAAYILLFSVADAKEADALGVSAAVAQIFNPYAVTKVFHKGGTAPFFIFLFAFIPLAFAVIDRFTKNEVLNQLLYWSGVLVLDGAVAYKVTEAVYGVNYARGNVDQLWEAMMAFKDMNFYLVFVFGAVGLMLFKLAYKKVIHQFKERSFDMLQQRQQVVMRQLNDELLLLVDKTLGLQEEIAGLEKKIIQLKGDIKNTEQAIQQAPILLNQELQKERRQLLTDNDTIDKIATIYTLHIQSDNLPISVDALKDRINVFLEGWNDYLFLEYAVSKATQKTAQAQEVAQEWQLLKTNNKLDKRVKIHAHE